MLLKNGVLHIEDENEAVSLLNEALLRGRIITDFTSICMENMQVSALYFPDEPVSYSITAQTAKSLSEYSNFVARAYCCAVYGDPKLSRLKSDDRHAVNVKFVARGGSTGYDIAKASSL
jgi:hypothetical protein